MPIATNYLNVPQEMKARKQWAVATLEVIQTEKGPKEDKAPRHPGSGYNVSPKHEALDSWATYEECLAAVQAGRFPVMGYILHETDPFTIIDLDKCLGVGNEPKHHQAWIIEHASGYREWSQSGTGLHIIYNGTIGGGFRRGGVEIYDRQRFMLMTGVAYPDWQQAPEPIQEAPAWVYKLVQEMAPEDRDVDAGGFYPEGQSYGTADALIDTLRGQDNGAKFTALFDRGPDHGLPGLGDNWSDLDAALIGIIANRSRSYAEVLEVFSRSALWRAPGSEGHFRKPKRASHEAYTAYVMDTISKQFRWRGQAEAADAQRAIQMRQQLAPMVEQAQAAAQVNGHINGHHAPTPGAKAVTLPPGMMGDIARFIHGASPRPVLEVSLAGAIGAMAAVAGRRYIFHNLGLNQYVMILAGTAIGKNAANTGARALFMAAEKAIGIHGLRIHFMPSSGFASGEGLRNELSKHPSCVAYLGEFGIKLADMSSRNAPAHLNSLKAAMLASYTASGPTGALETVSYSKTENNVKEVFRPAFSFVGDTTPGTYFDAVSMALISEGLMPRILAIHYDGNRPRENEAPLIQPPPHLAMAFGELAKAEIDMETQNLEPVYVQPAPGVMEWARQAYRDRWDDIMRADKDSPLNALWSRAWEKTLKLAALVAVGCNPQAPVVAGEHIQWAADLVERDIEGLLEKIHQGEVGTSEQRQVSIVDTAIEAYKAMPPDKLDKTYGLKLHKQYLRDVHNVIPYNYFLNYFRPKKAFQRDGTPVGELVKKVLEDACRAGKLHRLDPEEKKAIPGIHRDTELYAVPGEYAPQTAPQVQAPQIGMGPNGVNIH